MLYARALAILPTILPVWPIDVVNAQPSAPQAYRIGVGDKLAIIVYGQPDLSGDSTVDQNGNIRLPMIGDVSAINLTLGELEGSISRAFAQGFVRDPTVSIRVAEFSPIYVLGMVRTPGLFPYREGLSVLGAIARAGGIGSSEAQQSGLLGNLLQAEERVRLLEINRVALVTRRARLTALQSGHDRIDFPDVSGLIADPARIAQIRDGEQAAFDSERQALQQETEALQNQIPRLQAEIASLNHQLELEQQQRDLHHQLVADYDQLNKTGLARKSTYIEVKREEARIEEAIGRLQSDSLKAELSIGDVNFKITELRNTYQRRVTTELRETDRSLLDLTVTLPAAQHARAALGRQIGLLSAAQAQQPAITVIRAKGTSTVKYAAAADFLLQPGDVVQIGSLFPSAPELAGDQAEVSGGNAAQTGISSRPEGAAAARATTFGLAQTAE
ncbi:MAG TPA: polysaccharide biosynthesis/export family protein [Bradyrhizobium sp.]|nr:polysaccharide biosynthesis/export family protein [Bradyrhizobium sp.]